MGVKFKAPAAYPEETPELLAAREELAKAKARLAAQKTPLATITTNVFREENQLYVIQRDIRTYTGGGEVPPAKGGN